MTGPKHAGNPRLSDQAITDQARACAEEIRAFQNEPGLTMSECEEMTAADMADWLNDRNSRKNKLLGRALALLEIMAGEK